ncbi:putative biotin transporter, ATP-binding protein, BioM [Desulfonema limicola]|uniref:Biotin transporter, ATP-binding protein, BioM n=1 Tax=Desulfonema limicola TaxID=45656 RepID=A0A975B5M9_9BACT|nr:ABC transporter ATP-binding protein [Desulfonema limicola]QTA79250.1 putative biotin transporter, ATP-binding protein, BioM [Desulfonema limicola]
MNIIEIKNLYHRFSDGNQALDNISLNVDKGEFVIIAGANGSGKTTLLRHLNALILPQKGIVSIAGISTAKDPVRARQIAGMVFQDADSQIVGETVYDDVAFGPENLKLDRSKIRKRVSDALKAVNLTEFADKQPFMLSGGEKRRVAIAGILAMKSKILIFDEPFSNLDYPGVKQVLRHIILLHKSGHTIILTTHDLEKVLAHADRLVIMKSGKIVRNGAPESVIKGVDIFGIREPYASRQGMSLTSWLE